ncbi:MAG: branched-chain amino acid ABC transporter permease [Bacteroidia bacterium]|nr:branched-chain amino acid ABC transporter permease [Bacteroidia bacterium]
MLSQLIINGLIAGGVYSLIAIGYTMIYGVGKFINFAHGELYLCGAYCFYFFYTVIGWPMGVSFALALIAGVFLALILEKVAYRRFSNSSRLVPLITTIGASTFLKALVMLLFGLQTHSLLKGSGYQPSLNLAGTSITPIQVATVFTSLALMLTLAIFLKGTKVGKAIRATAENRLSAGYVGVDTDRISQITFGIGGLLAAVAGILVGFDQNIHPNMGILAGFKGFTAAVLGGIGSVPGAAVGGFCIGIAENLGAGYISSEYKDSISFVILLVILICKPQGIFGEK